MAGESSNIIQTYKQDGSKMYPIVLLDSLQENKEGGTVIKGKDVIKSVVSGMGMENLAKVSVSYDEDGSTKLVFGSDTGLQENGIYSPETIVGYGPFIVGSDYKDLTANEEGIGLGGDSMYLSKTLNIIGKGIYFYEDYLGISNVHRAIGYIIGGQNLQIGNERGGVSLYANDRNSTNNVEVVRLSHDKAEIYKDTSISGKLFANGSANVTNGLTVRGDVDMHANSGTYFIMENSDNSVELHAGNDCELMMRELNGNDSVSLRAGSFAGLVMDERDEYGYAMLNTGDKSLEMDGSGNFVKLQYDSSAYLEFKNKSVELQSGSKPYLKLGEGKNSVRLHAKDNLYLDLIGSTNAAMLNVNNNVYMSISGSGMTLKSDDYQYLEFRQNGFVDLYASTAVRLLMRGDSNSAGLYSGGTTSVSLDGSTYIATLRGDGSTYMKIAGGDKKVKLNAYNSVLEVDGSTEIVSANVPMKAKVNSVSDVYLGCPIGTVVMWAGETAPEGWLLCTGDTIAVTDVSQGEEDFSWEIIVGSTPQIKYLKITDRQYAELGKVIKGFYGVTRSEVGGQNVTHINLPKFQKKFPLGAQNQGTIGINNSGGGNGWSTTIGSGSDSRAGEATHTLTIDEIKHRHHVEIGADDGIVYGGDNGKKAATIDTINDAFDPIKAHNNIPPFLAINFIIKYK